MTELSPTATAAGRIAAHLTADGQCMRLRPQRLQRSRPLLVCPCRKDTRSHLHAAVNKKQLVTNHRNHAAKPTYTTTIHLQL